MPLGIPGSDAGVENGVRQGKEQFDVVRFAVGVALRDELGKNSLYRLDGSSPVAPPNQYLTLAFFSSDNAICVAIMLRAWSSYALLPKAAGPLGRNGSVALAELSL